MKLRYRVESRGWYIPQFLNKEDKWVDFKVMNIPKNSEIYDIAFRLGEYESWGDRTWHFRPRKEDKIEDMSLIFKTEILVCSFLGAAKLYFSERTKEFNI